MNPGVTVGDGSAATGGRRRLQGRVFWRSAEAAAACIHDSPPFVGDGSVGVDSKGVSSGVTVGALGDSPPSVGDGSVGVDCMGVTVGVDGMGIVPGLSLSPPSGCRAWLPQRLPATSCANLALAALKARTGLKEATVSWFPYWP